MATYQREPLIGGDSEIWGSKELSQNRVSIGAITATLYNDSGVLKITPGKLGINTGSSYGIVDISTVETIDFSSITNSRWFYVECTVTSDTATFSTVEISAGQNPAVIPDTFKDSYDPEKGGFYITSSRRVIGLGWKSAGGDLEGIVNVIPFVKGWSGISQSNDTNDIEYNHFQYIETFTSPVLLASGTITIPDLIEDLKIVFSGLSGDSDCNLPTAADNQGRTITIINQDSTPYRVDVNTESGETINGSNTIGLPSTGNFIILNCDGSNWVPLGFSITYETGWINTNDWTARDLGSTSSPKNTDSDVNHNIGLPLQNLNVRLFYSPTGVDSDSLEFYDTSRAGSSGYTVYYSDLDNVTLKTSGQGVSFVEAVTNTIQTLQTDDEYYNIRVSVKCI